MMNKNRKSETSTNHQLFEEAYRNERPRLLARLRAIGRTLEEAEDLVQDVYAETIERLPVVSGMGHLAAWIHWLFKRRMIDYWRHEQVRLTSGETDVSEDILREIISGAGLNPLDGYVRDCLIDALNDALHALPTDQSRIIEAQVFGGQTFREISESTGESINTLTARKRYALSNLTKALKHWIDD